MRKFDNIIEDVHFSIINHLTFIHDTACIWSLRFQKDEDKPEEDNFFVD